MIKRPIYKIPVITQTHMHNYSNTDKRTVSQLGRGGRTKFRPPTFCNFRPPPNLTHLTPAWSWLWTLFYQLLSMKKITKFFIGASRIISDRILNYFLVFVVGKVKFFLFNMHNYLDTDKRITARYLNRRPL